MDLLISNINSLSIFISLVILFTFVIIINIFKNSLKINLIEIILLTFYHLFFLFTYFYIFPNQNNDASQYFLKCFYTNDSYYHANLSYKSSDNINWLVQKLCIIFNYNILLITLIFNLIGTIGLLILYSQLKKIKNFKNKYLYLFILFICFPSIFFWTSTISKDTIAFTGLCFLILYLCRDNLLKNFYILILSLILILFSKPHIFIIVSIILVTLFFFKEKKIPIIFKILFLFIISFPIMYLINLILTYIGFCEIGNLNCGIFSFENLFFFYNNISNRFSESNTFLNDPFLFKIFYIFYLPSLKDINNLYSTLSLFETIFFVSLSLYFFILLPNKNFVSSNDLLIQFSYLFIFFMIILYALTIFNLGVFLRQKIYIYPFIFYLYLDRISNLGIKNQ